MAAKMQPDVGKEEYKKRKATVEWPFGNIKHNMKFQEFLTGGIENVRNEFNPVCTAHNMKVMWAKLCRTGSSLSEIVGLVPGQAAKVAAI